MADSRQNPLVPLIVGQFRRAALVSHFGHEDEDGAMQLAGLNSAMRAARTSTVLTPKDDKRWFHCSTIPIRR
jgi:hypothetical protein